MEQHIEHNSGWNYPDLNRSLSWKALQLHALHFPSGMDTPFNLKNFW